MTLVRVIREEHLNARFAAGGEVTSATPEFYAAQYGYKWHWYHGIKIYWWIQRIYLYQYLVLLTHGLWNRLICHLFGHKFEKCTCVRCGFTPYHLEDYY